MINKKNFNTFHLLFLILLILTTSTFLLILGCGKKNPVQPQPQSPIVWQRVYGGSGWDIAQSTQQTSDGGYIVGGPTDSFGAGGFDFYIIKTDANGNTGPYPGKRK